MGLGFRPLFLYFKGCEKVPYVFACMEKWCESPENRGKMGTKVVSK